MKRDPVELLAFSVARQLSAALGSIPVSANEHARGYGTLCATGHPVAERLWIQCTNKPPEGVLIKAELEAANMPSILGKARLPLVICRTLGDAATSVVTTRLWVLDELRSLAQCDADELRTPLDTLLSRLNHGDLVVVAQFDEFVYVLQTAIDPNAPRPGYPAPRTPPSISSKDA